MKACGIVVEYNPLHFGHCYHIKKAKEITNCDVLIAVMSANWTQRGEPAIISKEHRIRAALENGVDIVVELPFVMGVNSADIFAGKSIEILNSLKVREIVFGSETGNTDEFNKRYYQFGFSYPRVDELIVDFLDQGYGYPKARSLALKIVSDYYLETPNDILATAYVDAINKNNYKIKYHTIKRTSPYHQALGDSSDMSASAIRQALRNNIDIKSKTPMSEALINNDVHYLDDYFNLLRYKLLSSTLEDLQSIHLVEEGIESLFVKNIEKATNIYDFIKLCTSKRYSGARITRIIAHILNNTKKDQAYKFIHEPIPFIRLLGFNETGQKYLSYIRKEIEIPILARFQGKGNTLLKLERQASAVYFSTLPQDQFIKELETEISIYPIIVK